MPEISEELARALDALVRASDEAERAPTGRQEARRAVEAATIVARLARQQGFGRTAYLAHPEPADDAWDDAEAWGEP